jgi:DNA repair exonuclease SbcCD ATPase subunit
MKRSGFSHLTLKNFQSLADCDVPLGPLTCIVGDNDSGKSAMLRAITAACFNQTGTSYISHGADRASVELVLTDGDYDTQLLRWRKRREGGATYDLWTLDTNGEMHPGEEQRFSKLGAAVPPEVQAVLGIADIDVDKTYSITPQVHRQGEFAFIIDRSEGQAARALAKMTKLDVVVEAQGLIRTDLKRAKASLSSEKALVETLEQQLEDFEGLDEEVELLARVETRMANINVDIAVLAKKKIAFTTYVIMRNAHDDLGDLPDADVDGLMQSGFNAIHRQKQALNAYLDARDALARLPDPLPFISGFIVKHEQLQDMRTVYGAWKAIDESLNMVTIDLHNLGVDQEKLLAKWNAQDVCSACGQPLEKM